MITILVRTSNRPEAFARMFRSVNAQTFTNWQMLVATDDSQALWYIPSKPNVFVLKVQPDKSHPFYWNLYCNELKAQVTEGWFFFLDDDDYLISPRSLESASKYLSNNSGTVFQFMRNNLAKPSKLNIKNKQIIQGKIGGSCLFLHSKHRDLANWDGQKASDFRWIKSVSEKIKLNFVALPVVKAGNNGLHGKL